MTQWKKCELIINQRNVAPKLIRWYNENRRDLPWRPPLGTTARVDPYLVLVSEFMLQQTQVATVIAYFARFIAAFPTILALAKAPEQEVLRLWQGLGYYSRARNLRATAQQIVARHAGQVPTDSEALQSLPGIGRYTAGAIASIAFGARCPILDGNVARVLCRLCNIQDDPRHPKTRDRLWQIAEEILPKTSCDQFNSALMELGATICTPRQPECSACPVREHCRAFAANTQNSIPVPRKAKLSPLHHRWTFCIHRKNRWLIERRPSRGRWAGLWQFPTVEAGLQMPAHLPNGLRITNPKQFAEIRHALTHRRYTFTAFLAAALARKEFADSRWITLEQLNEFPLSRPQLKIADLLKETRDVNCDSSSKSPPQAAP